MPTWKQDGNTKSSLVLCVEEAKVAREKIGATRRCFPTRSPSKAPPKSQRQQVKLQAGGA